MYSFWMDAERFYTFTMPIVVIVLLVMAFVYVFVMSYTEKDQQSRGVITGWFGLMLLISLGYFIYGHLEYNAWVEQNDYIHPGIRKHSYILGIQTDEDDQLVQAFQRASSLYGNLTELDMYEAEKVTLPFSYEYLGSQEDTHYFSFGEDDQYAFRIRTSVNWTEDVREIQGWRFKLTDDRFEPIGFTREFDFFFDSLYLPADEQRELQDLSGFQMISTGDMFSGWIFGDQQF
ncbi:MAG: hypothetical protein JJU16_00995 [Alkalibacterium sp.]|nr:hypothetical protein [Alkalibacterium sp.]